MSDQFKCIEVGNWYSEYECHKCKGTVVVHIDSDNPTPEAHHTCPEKQ